MNFLEELHLRGMVDSTSDEAGLYAHLSSEQRRAYIGFDPTADSLTVGNLLPISMLRLFQKCGHQPVVLSGGGTGLVGDPSGKSLERPLLTSEQIAANIDAQSRIFERFLDFEGPRATLVYNNLDWLQPLGFLDTLREVGRHLSVFGMFAKESVQSRQATGSTMSYSEFSYQILQAYDFVHLHAEADVTIQMGGTDQWGNITTGLELVRKMRKRDGPAFGLSSALLVDKDGAKMGKSEIGAVWLSADRTSPYELYQYFINLTDVDAHLLYKRIAESPYAEVAEFLEVAAAEPSRRLVQSRLAREVVDRLHGEETGRRCESVSASVFGGDVRDLTEDGFELAFSHVPSHSVERARLASPGLSAAELLVESSLCSSRSDARRLLSAGAVEANGFRLGPDAVLDESDLLFDRYMLLRRGKKIHLVQCGRSA